MKNVVLMLLLLSLAVGGSTISPGCETKSTTGKCSSTKITTKSEKKTKAKKEKSVNKTKSMSELEQQVAERKSVEKKIKTKNESEKVKTETETVAEDTTDSTAKKPEIKVNKEKKAPLRDESLVESVTPSVD